ncbi:hypothetical protein KTJ20_10040 [Acinetobacter ursingii]|uniref:hypothetical protein n=1 Tax=Acinetobacter ursingii TaxID=108980 RepID=UPI0021CDDACA|nr:hypothetical protein [Acinetobacter ursingii]MCU4589090.1 hypothetical protein [Acinetobacter ursingii]
MKRLFLLLSMLMLPIFSFADGLGYGNTYWGMDPNQVLEAEKGKAQLTQPEKYKIGWGKVIIENINIGTGVFTATFLFDEEDKLIQTNLVSNEKRSNAIVTSYFDQLHKLLTQKYGEPTFKAKDTISWKTQSTTIELSKTYIPNVLAQTSIRYIPNSKVKSDTSNL